MKKSTLKEAIKTKIKSLLSEDLMTTDEAFRVLRDMQNIYVDKRKKDLMGRAIDALQAAEVSRMMDRERGLNESLNPEVTTALNRFIKAMAIKYDYEEQDAVYAIMAALEQRKSDTKYDMPGFGDTMDALDDISIREEKKEMTDAEKNKAAEKEAKEEKTFAAKQKEAGKLKKELEKNKDKLVKISKIPRNERTKSEQNLIDDMAKKTKELKKLKQIKV
jgi:vacuolar-type H+-ATPase subunit I/STV1